jgi:hypothetical protein
MVGWCVPTERDFSMAKTQLATTEAAAPKYDGPKLTKGGQPVYLLAPQVVAVLPNGDDSIIVLPGASIHVDGTPEQVLMLLEEND